MKTEIEKLKSENNTFNCMKLMVGIKQEKRVEALFPLWSLKKKLLKKLEFSNINLKLNVKETHRPTSN